MAQRAASLAPHDQNVMAWVAVLRAHAGDLQPLRELIARRPGTRRLLDWLRAHDEVQLSDEVMEQLDQPSKRAREMTTPPMRAAGR
jgi:hypothetical protein